ncbi:dihydrofolate reductase family protein [Streptomyces resistomycificus]|uniref:Deaminase n=1 Tax=Streptomyces resistomycificus TaxID=67356 RepID=A0A0L8L480_9ACTN|nr:dihydrofolate reductase family protein [Streptomyces resistomycificus]KOG32957.1 deaminase [Streptomyces resistomycificus]KUN92086.1 deaminase [Streptomyces resistomycificus]
MRKIVLMMSVSLDGYFEGPGHDIGWHRVDDEVHRHANDMVAAMGGLLHGRVTYELMAGFWPTADSDPEASAVTTEFATIWRDIPKVVYSRTLEDAGWNTTIVRDVVPEEVRALKAQPGGDLGLSGADLTAAFLRHDLVDEFRLYVHPVLLGAGRPLFPTSGSPADLRLTGSRTFGNGVVFLCHERDRAADR